MKESVKKGFGFGLTSGVITTLGLMIGLYSSTNSKAVVIGGIIVIAIADALSDALGIHISEESSGKRSYREIWEATFSTFVSKFFVSIAFVIPLLILDLKVAIIISIILGILMIAIFSYYLSKAQKIPPTNVIGEHIAITIFVVIATYYVGFFVTRLG
jgi:vacuolar iron transporter family protein